MFELGKVGFVALVGMIILWLFNKTTPSERVEKIDGVSLPITDLQ